jgi:hypothetical protein
MTESSREDRIRHLVKVAKSALTRADALLQGNTEYLRDELTRLREDTEVLLEKMDFEQHLLDLRDELHAVASERPPDTDRSPTTGIRERPRD